MMDVGSKLQELNLTRDEMSRLGEALKDEKFRELLREYAEEISSPENRRKYEEEISQLEEQRGVRAQFIHPEPHHVLKTRSARGKLFINICSNPLIDTPSSEAARDRRGTPGLRWRIPYSLTPARPDRDSAGNSCVTHDVIFHPDALRLAGNSRRFMKLLHSTAIEAIQNSFHTELENHSIKQLKMKYKGVPQAALIRTPIPGHQQNSGENLLPFQYPDRTQREPEPDQTQPGLDQSHTEPNPDQTQREPEPDQTEPDSRPPSSRRPTAPQYSVKYRSVVDLQDYRSSRDSGPGARPAEIIISVDLPLLGSAGDAELSVKQRRLVLESQNPAYKLDLPLSYPVDEDKGHATFNKTKKQLTVTLPVRPAPSTGFQWIRPDEMKSSNEDEEDEADQEPEEEVPEPRSDRRTLTHSAELQPSASEPQITGLTTEPQTLSDPALTRTEPQTLSDPALTRTEPQTLSDPALTRTELQKLSDPALTRTELQTLSDPALTRTEPQTLSDPTLTRTEPQTLSDPTLTRTELQTLSDPTLTRTEPQTLSDPTLTRTEPQEPDQICSVEIDQDVRNINQPVDHSSNTFSSESEITGNGGDEVSSIPETENTQESNTARDTLPPQQLLKTDNNSPINQLHSSSATHEQDPSSPQHTEELKKRGSSEAQESTADRVILREMERDGRDVFICSHKTSAALRFQNSLWSELD